MWKLLASGVGLVDFLTPALFVTSGTQLVPLVEQELPTLLKHFTSPWIFPKNSTGAMNKER
jgi:hypothetical protein